MAKYRKKPVVIEAFQLPAVGDDNVKPFQDWAEKMGFINWTSGRDETIEIETLEGTMCGSPLDFIIKGVQGEFYPCKPDIFEATYEELLCKHGKGLNDYCQPCGRIHGGG